MLKTTHFACSLSETRKILVVLGTVDELEENEPYTEWKSLLVDDDRWVRDDVFKGIRVTSIVYGLPHTWAIGDRGEIWYLLKDKIVKDQLPDSGIDGRHLGQPNLIRMVDGQPYICGFAGQFYTLQGKRWVHMDDGLAEQEGTAKSIDLEGLDGTASNDLYTVGSKGLVAHWDGKKWTRIKVLTNAALAAVKCISKTHVVAVGDNGVVVELDGKDWRVEQIPGAEELGLSDVAVYREQLYVAAGRDLYVRKGAKWQVVAHGLPKKKTDFFKLAVGLDRLWAMGSTRVASFDGKKWKQHLDQDNG